MKTKYQTCLVLLVTMLLLASPLNAKEERSWRQRISDTATYYWKEITTTSLLLGVTYLMTRAKKVTAALAKTALPTEHQGSHPDNQNRPWDEDSPFSPRGASALLVPSFGQGSGAMHVGAMPTSCPPPAATDGDDDVTEMTDRLSQQQGLEGHVVALTHDEFLIMVLLLAVHDTRDRTEEPLLLGQESDQSEFERQFHEQLSYGAEPRRRGTRAHLLRSNWIERMPAGTLERVLREMHEKGLLQFMPTDRRKKLKARK